MHLTKYAKPYSISNNNMEPFDTIDKWISEHGSASILRDHIALLKSQMSAKDAEIKNLQKVENNRAVSDDTCPYCQQQKGKLIDIRPNDELGELGVKNRYYKCENCGKEYNITQIPKF